MGCVCCSLSSFVSIVLNALERISLSTVCAMLVCCLLFTIFMILMLGIGIGYHYCTVQTNVEHMRKAAEAAGALRSGPEKPYLQNNVMRSMAKHVKKSFRRRISKRDSDDLVPDNKNARPEPEDQKTIDIDSVLDGTNYTNFNRSYWPYPFGY